MAKICIDCRTKHDTWVDKCTSCGGTTLIEFLSDKMNCPGCGSQNDISKKLCDSCGIILEIGPEPLLEKGRSPQRLSSPAGDGASLPKAGRANNVKKTKKK